MTDGPAQRDKDGMKDLGFEMYIYIYIRPYVACFRCIERWRKRKVSADDKKKEKKLFSDLCVRFKNGASDAKKRTKKKK